MLYTARLSDITITDICLMSRQQSWTSVQGKDGSNPRLEVKASRGLLGFHSLQQLEIEIMVTSFEHQYPR